jgi:uncharacterized protein YdeI (YjbR/CyaY-like superfamily)
VPDAVRSLLKKSALALKNLMRMSPSQRKLFVHYIDSAKRPETRNRLAEHAIDLLERNITLQAEFQSKLAKARDGRKAKPAKK